MSSAEVQAHKLYDMYYKQAIGLIGHSNTTNSLQLNAVGKSLFGRKYLGTFPRDMIPKFNRSAKSYSIINLDSSKEKGSHWVAVCQFADGKKQSYDSFGRNLKPILKIKTENSDISDREQMSKQIGDKHEETDCGQRSLAFLLVCHNHGYKVARLI